MRRLPQIAFAVLALLSVGAFFLVQHWKVADPLVWGTPYPAPSTFDPVGGRVCKDATGTVVDFRQTGLGLNLASQSDSVGVYVRAADNGPTVATLSSGTLMRRNHPRSFVWNGQRTGGGLAPPGTYTFVIVLHHQDRTIVVPTPVRLLTSAHPPGGGCFTHALKQ